MMEHLTLNNGNIIPALGLGTWLCKPGEVELAVIEAIKVGYRHIDCAWIYGNEGEIGHALEQCFNENLVKREDMFITSKLWMTYARPDLVRDHFISTLTNLKLAYLDLYLLHWPVTLKEGGDSFPKDADGNFLFSDVYYLDTWKEIEKLKDEGLVKSIGVCNFNHKQIENLIENSRIKPVVNQIEAHPYCSNKKLIEFCLEHKIIPTAYCPLGSPFNSRLNTQNSELGDPVILQLATKYNKSPSQIVIRYHLDRGISLVPKSVTPSRIKENFEVFDFKLSKEDIDAIDALNKPEGRIVKLPQYSKHPNYPFAEEY